MIIHMRVMTAQVVTMAQVVTTAQVVMTVQVAMTALVAVHNNRVLNCYKTQTLAAMKAGAVLMAWPTVLLMVFSPLMSQ